MTNFVPQNSLAALGPAMGIASVTPNDSADLAIPARALLIGSAGNVKVTCADDSTAILYNLQDGQQVDVRVKRVWATDTTASNITALL